MIVGEYSCLKVDLLFKREFSYYLIQIYIPCCMLVIVSWVSFWLDQGAVPARVSLGNPDFSFQELYAYKLLLFRGNYAFNNGDANLRDKRVAAARIVYKSNRCVDWCVFNFCIRSLIRIRTRQLRVKIGYASREYEETEETVRVGTRRSFYGYDVRPNGD